MSIEPSFSVATAKMESTFSLADTSHTIANTLLKPSASILSVRKSTAKILLSPFASNLSVSSPMPLFAPVMTMVLPFIIIFSFLSLWDKTLHIYFNIPRKNSIFKLIFAVLSDLYGFMHTICNFRYLHLARISSKVAPALFCKSSSVLELSTMYVAIFLSVDGLTCARIRAFACSLSSPLPLSRFKRV